MVRTLNGGAGGERFLGTRVLAGHWKRVGGRQDLLHFLVILGFGFLVKFKAFRKRHKWGLETKMLLPNRSGASFAGAFRLKMQSSVLDAF